MQSDDNWSSLLAHLISAKKTFSGAERAMDQAPSSDNDMGHSLHELHGTIVGAILCPSFNTGRHYESMEGHV